MQNMLRRTSLKRKTPLKRKTKLRLVGHSTSAELKIEIQAMLRAIVMIRDGGCFLRNYTDQIMPSYRSCGPLRNDGELVLQAEHLHSRGNANSFSDSRLVVCCCMRHHFYYKKQYPEEYYRFANDFIGEERRKLLARVQQDRSPHKVDLKLELLALTQEYKKLSDLSTGTN